jgi:phosphatidylglycerol:prolipoprotein diacylglycerol transferase
MFIDGHYREAAFLYESIADFLLFLFLFFYLKKDSRENGDVLAFYLIFYSVFRYFIEELRTDSLLIFGLQTAQLMSILMIILGVYILIKNHLYKKIN